MWQTLLRISCLVNRNPCGLCGKQSAKKAAPFGGRGQFDREEVTAKAQIAAPAKIRLAQRG